MMRSFKPGLSLAGLVVVAAGCTSGNSAIEPPFRSTSIPTVGVLEFAVGTANIAQMDGSAPLVGLNTVVTFRKANGGSAVAVDSPAIAGPAGFLVPATSAEAGTDAGTRDITSSAQPTSNTGTPAATTFGTLGSATLYGFGPNNYDTSGTANYGTYALPIYDDTLSGGTYVPASFDGLPPAFPAPPAGTGFTGYNLGFVPFAAAAVTGTYSLAVLVPVAAGSSQAPYTYHASAMLDATRVLPPLAGPVFTPDAAGTGGTLAVAFPAGVNEIVVELTDVTAGSKSTYLFTTASPAPQTVADGTLAANTDEYLISAIGCDYGAFELAAPANRQQTPAIVGAAGQDDVTISAPQDIAPAAAAAARRRHAAHARSIGTR